MQSFGASQEMDRPHKGFSLVKGIIAATVFALSSFSPGTEAAVIRRPADLRAAPDGFPMFIQHEDYTFDPAKIAYVRHVDISGNVDLFFENNLQLSYVFKNETVASKFVNDILFGNVVTIEKTPYKK